MAAAAPWRLQLAGDRGWVNSRGRGGSARVLRRMPVAAAARKPPSILGRQRSGSSGGDSPELLESQPAVAAVASAPPVVDVFGAAYMASLGWTQGDRSEPEVPAADAAVAADEVELDELL